MRESTIIKADFDTAKQILQVMLEVLTNKDFSIKNKNASTINDYLTTKYHDISHSLLEFIAGITYYIIANNENSIELQNKLHILQKDQKSCLEVFTNFIKRGDIKSLSLITNKNLAYGTSKAATFLEEINKYYISEKQQQILEQQPLLSRSINVVEEEIREDLDLSPEVKAELEKSLKENPIKVEVAKEFGKNLLKLFRAFLQWGAPAATLNEIVEQVFQQENKPSPLQTFMIFGVFGQLLEMIKAVSKKAEHAKHEDEHAKEKLERFIEILEASEETISIMGVYFSIMNRILGEIEKGDLTDNETKAYFASVISVPVAIALIVGTQKIKEALQNEEQELKDLVAHAEHKAKSLGKKTFKNVAEFLILFAGYYELANIPGDMVPDKAFDNQNMINYEKYGKLAFAGTAAVGTKVFTEYKNSPHLSKNILEGLEIVILFGYAAHLGSLIKEACNEGAYGEVIGLAVILLVDLLVVASLTAKRAYQHQYQHVATENAHHLEHGHNKHDSSNSGHGSRKELTDIGTLSRSMSQSLHDGKPSKSEKEEERQNLIEYEAPNLA